MQGPVYSVEIGKPIRIYSDAEKIAWNILEALRTPFGSRPCLPNFGSKLHLLKFELLDNFFIDLCKIYITDCIQTSVEGVSIKDIKVEKISRNGVRFDILFVDEASLMLGTSSLSFNDGKWSI